VNNNWPVDVPARTEPSAGDHSLSRNAILPKADPGTSHPGWPSLRGGTHKVT
jgi:hypothetical protein